jgi:uncharacterized protein (TIGR01777 family)
MIVMTLPMPEKLCVAVTGATGLIGLRLCQMLADEGHKPLPISRWETHAAAGGATWDVDSGTITFPEKVDVLVHLAGRSIAARWSSKLKRELWDSRIPATEKLCNYLAKLPTQQRPRLLIAASAVGIYGNRGDEVLTEDSATAPQGAGFLSDLCRAWEAATHAANAAAIRVIHLRTGVVLAGGGGALAKLATPTKLGLGGPVGPGTQFLPWISLTDICRLIISAARSDTFGGILHAVGPAPVRQHEFMRTLGKVLHRPTVFPLPTLMVKLMFGQMGEEVLLASQRVLPTKLPAGFAFTHTTLEAALRAEMRP